MRKKYFNVYVEVFLKLFAIALCIFIIGERLVSARSITQAEVDRKYELIDQGYSGEVIEDQLYEEFYKVDGPYGTGGIDGLKLDGSPASGTTTTTTATQPSTPTHAHSWSTEIVKDATCLEKGEVRHTCAGCGESYTEGTPVVDHNYEATEETDATCIAYSTVTFICTVCGDTMIEEKGELADHIYIATNDCYDATCEEDGYTHYVCSVCGDEYEAYPKALGHEWAEEYTIDTKAGCETEGKKSIHCTRCDIIKDGSEMAIEPMGHTENENHDVTEPTFFKEGLEVIHCAKCKEPMETIILPATGSVEELIIPIVSLVAIIGVIIAVFVLAVKKAKKNH